MAQNTRTEKFILNYLNIHRENLGILIKKKTMQYCLNSSSGFLILTFGGILLSIKYISNTVPEMIFTYEISTEILVGFKNVIFV